MHQPGKVANPARGQLNSEESLVSRDGFGTPASACSFSILRLSLVLTNGIPPDFLHECYSKKQSERI